MVLCYLQALGAIRRGSCGSMLAYVGFCLVHICLRLPQVGSKMAQDKFMLAQVGFMLPKKAPKRPPKYHKMRPKWLQDGFQVNIVGGHCS